MYSKNNDYKKTDDCVWGQQSHAVCKSMWISDAQELQDISNNPFQLVTHILQKTIVNLASFPCQGQFMLLNLLFILTKYQKLCVNMLVTSYQQLELKKNQYRLFLTIVCQQIIVTLHQ
eukprot:TRINITY_DN50757_c0_g1_i1.p2 TRINITY_DN50757_c0_g1~~TRINITY_DN50757_c0_g1_i1.p2  ORF type:complete len:118 (-),score=0.69 TRINITY_DN50757_c0_g1_i1:158-511(-)